MSWFGYSPRWALYNIQSGGANREKPRWSRWRSGRAADAGSNGNRQIFGKEDYEKSYKEEEEIGKEMEAESGWPAIRRRRRKKGKQNEGS